MSSKSCLPNGFNDNLVWNQNDKSEEVNINSKRKTVAFFHPVWSSGTAAVRGNKPINKMPGLKYYWEVKITDRVFGTSMMIGITTRAARLEANSFVNLIGENQFGWGLSHKGLIWHAGKWKVYTAPFLENANVVLGCLYDGEEGTLTFYKDNRSLGVAFHGLEHIKDDLYPTIASTAAKTEFVLTAARREFINLQDICRNVIRSQVGSEKDFSRLALPQIIISYLKLEDEQTPKCARLSPACAESRKPCSKKPTSSSIPIVSLGLCNCYSPKVSSIVVPSTSPALVSVIIPSTSSGNKKRSKSPAPSRHARQALHGFKRTKIPMPDL